MLEAVSVKDKFALWLADRVSYAKLSELYIVFDDIEKLCIQKNIINKSLFETTELDVIKVVVDTINSRDLLSFKYKNKQNKMRVAIRYYYDFIKSMNNRSEKNSNNDNSIDVGDYNMSKDDIFKGKSYNAINDYKADKLRIKHKVNDQCIIDFSVKEDMTYTKPVLFSYFGKQSTGINNWTQLYIQVVKCLMDDYPLVFKHLINKNINTNGSSDFTNGFGKNYMRAPKKVKGDYYLETNLNAGQIVSKIKSLLDACNVDYENLEVRYIRKKHEEKKSDFNIKTGKAVVTTKHSYTMTLAEKEKRGMIAAYFVSKYKKRALTSLGYHSYGDFYGDVGKRIGISSYDIKKYKGDFDLYLSSNNSNPFRRLSTLENDIIGALKRYTEAEILELLKRLLSDFEKDIKLSTMNIICFHNPDEENGYLSNWYISYFKVNGIEFSSMEQYLMYRKAVCFNDRGSADKIIETDDVAEIKALGRGVSGYDDHYWNGVRQVIVYEGLVAKFSQNKDLKERLLDTGNDMLAVCAVKDRIWGIGLSMDDPDRHDMSKWKGQNLLGYALMMVRAKLSNGIDT